MRNETDRDTFDQEPAHGAGPGDDAGPGDSPETSEPEGDTDLVMNELMAQQLTPAPYEAGLVEREVTRRARRATVKGTGP